MSETDNDTRTNGVMVAFKIPRAAASKLVLPGGDPIEQLHMTISYYGKEDELTDAQKNCLRNLSHRLAILLDESGPLTGVVSGLGYFQNKNKNHECLYASIDMPGLNSVYEFVLQESLGKNLPIRHEHGFTAHVTLRYQPVDTPRPRRKTPLPSLTFGPKNVVCKIGSEINFFNPQERSICPGCSYDDCICIEISSTEKSFRAYVGSNQATS